MPFFKCILISCLLVAFMLVLAAVLSRVPENYLEAAIPSVLILLAIVLNRIVVLILNEGNKNA